MRVEPLKYERHLLVVDDEIEILKSLKRQFRKKVKVHIANSAQEGLDILKQYPVQVIISDQRMPEMTGSEFFTTTKEKYPDAIRLLLTGYADISAVIEAINQGNIFRYVTKPWDPVELETILDQAYERYELIVQNRHLMQQLKEANATLEERVAQRTAELEETNRLKDKFVSLVAHDLRSPFNGILGMLQILLQPNSDDPLSEENRRRIEQIIKSGKGMIKMIGEILNISRLQTGKIQPRCTFLTSM